MSDPLSKNRLVEMFAAHRRDGRKALLPFLTAGYPDVAVTEALLGELERRGCEVCELGVPFSDPIADGPTIQASYTEALNNGVTSEKIFQAVRRFRQAGGSMALLAMVSYSIVYRHGVEAFLDRCLEAGFDGTILPDLSLEEAARVESAATQRGLCNVMLVSPTSSPDRRRRIAEHSRGFVYFMSVAGITGERDRLPEQTIAGVRALREHVDVPICVGFGISSAEMVRTVCGVADGAIVGSAIVRRIRDLKSGPLDAMQTEVGQFVEGLLAGTR